MNRKFKYLKIGLMVVFFFGLVSFIVMQLWNWLMPDLFGLPLITFWKSAGLLILSKILFSGFRRGHHGPNQPWNKNWQEKWRNMPDEKRAQWKQRFADKWCPQSPTAKEDTNEAN
ncbi:MAG: hypothetical protein RJQ14_20375 [Marinoscillum sp.]